ncbi:conserved hypothetical protein, secreted [sediment metagenome]|uniref:PDZ domain-containing protein n=1 Tax=sediment metagenome TaxID=749907 RepID=D9PJH9_9ZZZZ
MHSRLLSTLLALATSLCLPGTALAIVAPDNLGQWDKPTKIGPDKEVPGFLVNLGPTGARAILKESSFVVKHVFSPSPAHGKLHIDDEITGIHGKPFSKHTFGKCYSMEPGNGYEGPIMDLGTAIEECEGKDGSLTLDVTRNGTPIQVTIPLDPIGRFSDTFPKNCKKSQKLTARALDYLLQLPASHKGDVHEKGLLALALLSQGKTKEAEAMALAWNQPHDENSWTWYPTYQSIFLAEYFLQTGDKRVLPTIQENCKRLYLSQVIDPSLYKDRMHSGQPQAANYLKGGNGHGARIAGYGTMTITTLMTLLTWELAEDCGIQIENFNRDLAYDCIHTHTNETGYMGYRFATGAYSPVGLQGLSLIVHRVAGRPDTADYMSRVTRGLETSKTRLNDGHGDNSLAWGWALLGIQLSGNHSATRSFLDYNKAFLNMARTHDGSFVIQPGRNLHEKAYYMSPRIHPTAAMVLALGKETGTLRIQGTSVAGASGS